MSTSRRTAAKAFAALLLPPLLLAPVANAQDRYPSRPIRLVVPYAAGGPLDAVARAVTLRMAERLGQPIIIDNRPGGGGTIGMDSVANGPADGYSLIAAAGTGVYFYHFLNRSNFSFKKEFASLGQIYETTAVIYVNPNAPETKNVRTINDLVAYAKTVPQLPVTGSGYGSTAHLLMLKMANITGARFTYVPYKGLGPALTDVLGGQVPVYVGTITQASLAKEGKLRAIAVAGPKREPVLPEVPTLTESGIPNLYGRVPVGIAAPAATPPAIVNRLREEFRAAMEDPAVIEKLNAAGVRAAYEPGPEFGENLSAEFDSWGKVIRDNNIKAQ